MMYQKLYDDAVALLQKMIATPSISRAESDTADLIEGWLKKRGVATNRFKNNVWAYNLHFDATKPTLLINSHHDTVKPNAAYTRDPFAPTIENGLLYGLGSNDAGASAVGLLATFMHFYADTDLTYNICIAITGEEEVSGREGIECILDKIGPIEFAIVGEPTLMQMAIAERGLLVLDCTAHGKAGHAARNEGDNAIYRALKDIEWFRTYEFPEVSELFGPVKMSVTQIEAGTQHNVVPAECKWVVDVRVTDRYTNEQVVEHIRERVSCDVTPRSLRLKPSYIDPSHPVVQAGKSLGLTTFGSPTSSDQMLLNVPSLKMGIGDSARSHSADEYVGLDEIKQGIETYINILTKVIK